MTIIAISNEMGKTWLANFDFVFQIFSLTQCSHNMEEYLPLSINRNFNNIKDIIVFFVIRFNVLYNMVISFKLLNQYLTLLPL